MSTFTPGPWAVLYNPMGVDYVVGDDCTICSMPGWDADYEDEELANARLISAAPDLYEALKELIDMDVAYQRGQKVSDAVDKARAALAKAEGKS